MGKKLAIVCPHCSSYQVVLNGHYHKGMPQFLCHSCGKYFYENSAKGFPPTSIPFPVIAYLLYFRKRIPPFSNMREYRRFVSQWLKCLSLRDTDVDRHTIRHWIKNYDSVFEKLISFEKSRNYCNNILQKNLKVIPKDVIKAKSHPYKKALHSLEQYLGRDFCVELSRSDPVFFHELTSIVSKYPVYCKASVEDEQQLGRRLFFKGVVQ